MLDERWVFHENAKAEPAGEGVVRRVLAYSKDLMCVENTLRQGQRENFTTTPILRSPML